MEYDSIKERSPREMRLAASFIWQLSICLVDDFPAFTAAAVEAIEAELTTSVA